MQTIHNCKSVAWLRKKLFVIDTVGIRCMWRTLEFRTQFCHQLIIWPNANHLTARVSQQSDAQGQKGRSDNLPRSNLYNRWLPHFDLIYLASLLLNCLSVVYSIFLCLLLSSPTFSPCIYRPIWTAVHIMWSSLANQNMHPLATRLVQRGLRPKPEYRDLSVTFAKLI